MNRRFWVGGGALLLVLVAAVLLVWRPWALPYGGQTACTFYRQHPAAGQPMCLTWPAAESRYAAWVRKPTWLPPAVEWQQLTIARPLHGVVSPPSLTIFYEMPHGASIQVFESPSVVSVSFGQLIANGKAIAPPRVQATIVKGLRAHMAAWTVHNPGQALHLNEIWVDVNHHTYQVMGSGVPLADVKNVVAGLIP